MSVYILIWTHSSLRSTSLKYTSVENSVSSRTVNDSSQLQFHKNSTIQNGLYPWTSYLIWEARVSREAQTKGWHSRNVVTKKKKDRIFKYPTSHSS